MFRLFGKLFKTLTVVIIIVLAYQYRLEIGRFIKNRVSEFKPCNSPLTYSIGTLDSKFGISREELLKEISQAEEIWEIPIGKNLYQYIEEGGMVKINLIYDYRQEATDKLKKIGVLIDNDQDSFNALKARHASLIASYTEAKALLDSQSAKFEKEKAFYETQVKYWNGKGGAPEPEYSQLTQKKKDLNAQVLEINQQVKIVNQYVNDINTTASILNQLAKNLNLKVKDYNTIGSSTGKEFKEGEYIRDGFNRTIDIYQFSNNKQLLRVMAHELGHAIGLNHLDNPKAIMYFMNEGLNETATGDDVDALKTVCGIK